MTEDGRRVTSLMVILADTAEALLLLQAFEPPSKPSPVTSCTLSKSQGLTEEKHKTITDLPRMACSVSDLRGQSLHMVEFKGTALSITQTCTMYRKKTVILLQLFAEIQKANDQTGSQGRENVFEMCTFCVFFYPFNLM